MVVAPPSCLRRESPSKSTWLLLLSSSSCRNMTSSPERSCSSWTTSLSPPQCSLSEPSEPWFRRSVSSSSSSVSTTSSTTTSSTTSTSTSSSLNSIGLNIHHNHKTKKKKVSFVKECYIHEYITLELTPEQRSTMWWDANELDRFRSKRKHRRERTVRLISPSLLVVSSSRLFSSPPPPPARQRSRHCSDDDPTKQVDNQEPFTLTSPSSVVDDRPPSSPPPPPLQTDHRHCSHPRQVVYVYRVYKDEGVEGEKETGSELVREFSRRSSKQARDKAHHRAVVLSQSTGTYSVKTSSHPSSSSFSYPLLQNRFFGLSSRLTDVYLESLLETIERNWLCGGSGATNTGTAGSITRRTWGMEQESVEAAA